MKKINLLLLGLLSLVMFSCINEEGEGGTAVVQGKVYKVLHSNGDYPIVIETNDTLSNDSIAEIGDQTIITKSNDTIFFDSKFVRGNTTFLTKGDTILSLKVDTFPAAKEDVYIVYGDEPIYGDKMETGYDGFYRFKFLTKGTYRVFAYSTLPNSEKKAVVDTVTVAYGETKNVQNLYIHEGKSYETSYIVGKVRASYYKSGRYYPAPAYDQRVFIRKKGAAYHFDEVKTGLNGTFIFQGLKSGVYEVFVFTEDVNTEVLRPAPIQEVIVDGIGVYKTTEIFYILINS